MPKFIAVLEQRSEGCDYTIGCGVRVNLLDATTRSDAEIEAFGILREHLPEHERELAALTVYEVADEIRVNVAAGYAAIAAEKANAAGNEQKARDLAELARLKARYPEGV